MIERRRVGVRAQATCAAVNLLPPADRRPPRLEDSLQPFYRYRSVAHLRARVNLGGVARAASGPAPFPRHSAAPAASAVFDVNGMICGRQVYERENARWSRSDEGAHNSHGFGIRVQTLCGYVGEAGATAAPLPSNFHLPASVSLALARRARVSHHAAFAPLSRRRSLLCYQFATQNTGRASPARESIACPARHYAASN
ncbi:hypothetical protein EVAR_89049_1 [Eumeta japonica]|uniref:Uncharacterized protein n=1 Tax=Eumeta variegata TaxID=151549 RepID=A0A4C1YZP1_EUMVA|nr:hypothetical protein EVAR_89049_1 [Eumeta japonica]